MEDNQEFNTNNEKNQLPRLSQSLDSDTLFRFVPDALFRFVSDALFRFVLDALFRFISDALNLVFFWSREWYSWVISLLWSLKKFQTFCNFSMNVVGVINPKDNPQNHTIITLLLVSDSSVVNPLSARKMTSFGLTWGYPVTQWRMGRGASRSPPWGPGP